MGVCYGDIGKVVVLAIVVKFTSASASNGGASRGGTGMSTLATVEQVVMVLTVVLAVVVRW